MLFDGQSIGKCKSLFTHVGYVPQNIRLCEGSIRDNVALGLARKSIDDGKVRKALEIACFSIDSNQQQIDLDMPIGENGERLSGGQRQRLGLARALYHGPKLIVLDEGTSALDRKTEAGFLMELGRLGGDTTKILITHRPESLKSVNRIIRVVDGDLTCEIPQATS